MAWVESLYIWFYVLDFYWYNSKLQASPEKFTKIVLFLLVFVLS